MKSLKWVNLCAKLIRGSKMVKVMKKREMISCWVGLVIK